MGKHVSAHVILVLHFLHERGTVEKLAGLFPGTYWVIFNEMRWHGDAGWFAAGREMSDSFGLD